MPGIDKILQPNKTAKLTKPYSPTQTIHIRAIVDNDQVVYRVYSHRKGIWVYHIVDISLLVSFYLEGWLVTTE